jgi:hypothetical protein
MAKNNAIVSYVAGTTGRKGFALERNRIRRITKIKEASIECPTVPDI